MPTPRSAHDASAALRVSVSHRSLVAARMSAAMAYADGMLAGTDEAQEEAPAGKGGPDRDRAVEERRLAGVVLGDVHEAELVRHERADHRQIGHEHEGERPDLDGSRARERPAIALPAGVRRG